MNLQDVVQEYSGKPIQELWLSHHGEDGGEWELWPGDDDGVKEVSDETVQGKVKRDTTAVGIRHFHVDH